MQENEWGTGEWLESKFTHPDVSTLGDGWGHRWRGSQKFRYSLCSNMLRPVLTENGPMNVLDVGCALGDFTAQAWRMNPDNKLWAVDISKNAIARASKEHPDIRFSVAALPELPFRDHLFDCIICLEVLCYLDSQDRQRAIEHMHGIMRRGGQLLLSGVLDGGARYFTRDGILELVSERFEIQRITYNYAKLYSACERRVMRIRENLNSLSKIFRMSKRRYEEWSREKQRRRKLRLVRGIRTCASLVPFGRSIVGFLLGAAARTTRALLGRRCVVAACHHVTRLILGDKGATHAIILARRR